jgi:prepilin-type N-terminal cleavage/methylation domain-containing protein
MIHDEKGFTLLEVLISIVLLSVIFLSIMNFFPQMGLINQENENKTKAINTAQAVLVEWEHNDDVTTKLKNNINSTAIPGYYKSDSNYYYYKTVKDNFNVIIKIKMDSDLVSAPIKTRLIKIQVLNKRNNVVGETFGYIIVK